MVKLLAMSHACNSPKCGVCQNRLVKNGKTKAGKTRWRCLKCGASRTITRPDRTNAATLKAFVSWLLGKQSQTEAGQGYTPRTWRNKTRWCWNIDPYIPQTGQIHHQVFIDGIYLPYKWCLLVASTREFVIDWQWCGGENIASYTAFLSRIPAPDVVVCDGQAGCLSVIKTIWPNTRIQRCLVHVQRNTRTKITMRPRTPQGKALRRLSLKLTRIETSEQAAKWCAQLAAWHGEYRDYLNERTNKTDVVQVPSFVGTNQKWWYTHRNLRSAYRQLERLVRDGVLFTYLDEELTAQGPLDSTTNRLEGGVNAGIRRLLRDHRGLSENHMRLAVQWLLYSLSESPQPLGSFITPEVLGPSPEPEPEVVEQDGPSQIDNGIDFEEQTGGLHVRKGNMR